MTVFSPFEKASDLVLPYMFRCRADFHRPLLRNGNTALNAGQGAAKKRQSRSFWHLDCPMLRSGLDSTFAEVEGQRKPRTTTQLELE